MFFPHLCFFHSHCQWLFFPKKILKYHISAVVQSELEMVSHWNSISHDAVRPRGGRRRLAPPPSSRRGCCWWAEQGGDCAVCRTEGERGELDGGSGCGFKRDKSQHRGKNAQRQQGVKYTHQKRPNSLVKWSMSLWSINRQQENRELTFTPLFSARNSWNSFFLAELRGPVRFT